MLPSGALLETSGSSFGVVLFRVSPAGVILETIDTSRNSAVLELVTLADDAFDSDLAGSADPNDPALGVPHGVVDAIDLCIDLDRFAAGCLCAAFRGAVHPHAAGTIAAPPVLSVVVVRHSNPSSLEPEPLEPDSLETEPKIKAQESRGIDVGPSQQVSA